MGRGGATAVSFSRAAVALLLSASLLVAQAASRGGTVAALKGEAAATVLEMKVASGKGEKEERKGREEGKGKNGGNGFWLINF